LTNQSIVINEQILLNLCRNNPDFINQMEDYFLSDIGHILYKTFQKLYLEKMELTNQNILLYCNTDKITNEMLNELNEVKYETYYFPQYYEKLKKEYYKKELDKTHKDLFMDLQSKNELSLEKWKEYQISIENALSMIEGYKSSIISGEEAFNRYKEVLNLRASGDMKFDIGCSYLNSWLTYGAYPGLITTIFASTGMSKSSFVLYLRNKQCNKYIPNLMLGLENGFDMNMDRIVANELEIDASELVHINDDTYDYIISQYDTLEKKFKKNYRSYLVAGEMVDFKKLKLIIKDAMRQAKVDYMIVTIDLGSHISGFGEKPDQMIRSMKLLQQMGKDLNVHFILVFQANRDTDKTKVNVKEDIEKLRPNLKNIYGGDAMAQGSQAVLSIFRKRHYMEKYFPDDPELDILDDIAEVSILKQNGGKCGILDYLFDPNTYNFTKYEKCEIIS
jgi:replicative DNA helicase